MGLARTGKSEFVVCGGDCCHDRLLFTQAEKYTTSTFDGPGGNVSLRFVYSGLG